MTGQAKIHALGDRALIHITGEEASAFLQNLVTCDVRRAGLQYGCLLTAQGQLLHDFFVFPDGAGGYFLDCDAGGRDGLIRRLGLYKLRARVGIAAAEGLKVYVAPRDSGKNSYADPRLPQLGYRVYTDELLAAAPGKEYDDLCISLCIPPARAVKTGRDFLTNLNLDLLHGVDWDKGCFVGQEVAARIEHRGLVKRRLMVVEGAGLAPADQILCDDVEAGDIRAVDSTGLRGLALVKLALLPPLHPPFAGGEGGVRGVARPGAESGNMHLAAPTPSPQPFPPEEGGEGEIFLIPQKGPIKIHKPPYLL